jgi:hypothetical protein
LGSHKGLPDLTAIRGGQVWWIEVKTPRGHLSEDQDTFRRDVQDHGGNWLLARSIEDVEFLARPEVHRLPLAGGRALRPSSSSTAPSFREAIDQRG